MTLSQLTPNLSSSYWCCCLDDPRNVANSNNNISFPGGNSSRDGLFPLEIHHRSRRIIRRRDFGVVEVRGRMNVSDVTTTTSSSNYSVENGQIRNGGVEIPVSCYQIIGVSNQAEKDEIVKSAMDLKNAEAEEGYTLDAVVSRQDLLIDVRDKLLFEPEYAGNAREKIQPKSSLRIPWSWVPGALCLLQEAGEEKLVLEIGRAALQHPDANPYIHDILLSMALAECAIAKSWFEKNKVSQGFEALARAQHLLKTKASLGNMPLLSQIEESLEELAPSCALEILDIPNSPENAERRRGAIAALRELLSQGLDVELSCQVRDWPVFLSQALLKLSATEIVDLLPWDSIAVARKNKKSLESQNQRVVIDLNCFYRVMIAHIAFGFSNKQKIMIDKAKMIGDCLVASEGVELKFENALCSFLLGQGSETEAVERLRDLEIDSVPASRYFMQEKEASNSPDVKPSLEKWLKDSVLGLFSDTRDSSPSLETYFRGEKRTLGLTKQTISIPKSYQTISRRPSIVQTNRVGTEESPPLSNSVRHSGAAVTQLAPSDMQSPLTGMKTSSGNGTTQQSVQMKRKLGSHHENIWDSWPISGYTMGRVALATVVGCLAVIAFKLLSIPIRQMRRPVQAHMIKPTTMEYNAGPAHIGGKNIARNLRNLLITIFDKRLKQLPDDRSSQSSLSVDELFPFSSTARMKPMPVEEAENLVKQWQAIKAEALGPEYQVHILPEVLAEPMLVEWQALSNSAKDRSCFWRFVLLDMSILRADILSDGNGSEVAEIEALLEEAAELVDDSQIKNPNYYSTYKIRYVLKRQDDGSWRFCRWDVQTQT